MSTKMILFDLDGTLLPMDQEMFVKAYFAGIAKKAAPYGYHHEEIVKTIWTGTAAMVKNNGDDTNENVFWKVFADRYGEDALKDQAVFDEFYLNEFEVVRNSCGFNPKSRECINLLKDMGYRIALATNPIFPAVATQARIRWAGLTTDDFELYTTYENSRHCKPNPEYYLDILKDLQVSPEDCLMVGNDVEEDMVAGELGMKVFLLTDCLINKHNKDITKYPHGTFDDLIAFINAFRYNEK